MSREDFLSTLISSEYEPCPPQPTPPWDDLPWTTYPELSPYLQSASPPNIQPNDVIVMLPDTSSVGDSDISSTGIYFDGINAEIHATNTSVARACPYTLVQSQSASPPDVPPNEVAFTLPYASRSFDALGFWSADAYSDGINGGTDATNPLDHAFNGIGFPYPPQVEGDTSEDVLDHRVACGAVGGEHDGMGFCTKAGPISPDPNSCASTHGSALNESGSSRVYRPRWTENEYRNVVAKSTFRSQNVRICETHFQTTSLEKVALTSSTCLLFSVNLLLNTKSRDTVVTPLLNSSTFNGSSFTKMDVDSLVSRPSTENSTSASVFPTKEAFHDCPPPTTSVYRPFLDDYGVALSSKTIFNQAFEQDQASEVAAITDAKFICFGRIGRSTVSKCESKKTTRKPYQKSTSGPKMSKRQIYREGNHRPQRVIVCEPTLSLPKKFQLMTSRYSADGRHKYERLTDFETEQLRKVYNVTAEEVPSVFYGLRRQHTSDILYTCPMDGGQFLLAQFEAHCLEQHSTISCGSDCPNRGDKASKDHPNHCPRLGGHEAL
ncbi:hypothetical protein F5146DRAFT_997770 [Armillaria mellea]|nr:hypothetical protein F5146DRAFT_997770 [Armillaria mellea]